MFPANDEREEYQRISVEILFTDLELALTFTDTAILHATSCARQKSLGLARRAYEQITKARFNFPMSPEESDDLDARLEVLKQRLEQLSSPSQPS